MQQQSIIISETELIPLYKKYLFYFSIVVLIITVVQLFIAVATDNFISGTLFDCFTLLLFLQIYPLAYSYKIKLIPYIFLVFLVLFFFIPLIFLIENKIINFCFSSLYVIAPLSFLSLQKILIKQKQKIFYVFKFNLEDLVIGLGSGLLISAHLFIAAYYSQKINIKILNINTFVFYLFFVMFFSCFAEEIFYRGLLLQKLLSINYNWKKAALFIGIVNFLRYLFNTQFLDNPLALLGLFFYVILNSYVFCFIFLKRKNLFPSYIANIIFSFCCYFLQFNYL